MHYYMEKKLISQAMLTALLRNSFADIAHVHFIQIGANDGVSDDFVFPLATQNGWIGAVIEPVPHLFEKLTANYRPFRAIKPFQVVIGETESCASFYHFAPSPGELVDFLGSLERNVIMRHACLVPDIESRIIETKLKAVSMGQVTEFCGLSGVDLLVTDVEGADAKLVRAFNFGKHMPRVIVIEHKHIGHFDLVSLDEFLDSFNYTTIRLFEDTVYIRLTELPGRPARSLACKIDNAAKAIFG
ncbi:MAG: FkbM family methyltransferase [Hyphomicrobiaceae bacterium]|nr:FkbM family methyltransferase [Hyphomicrobiaceae bacterium]